MTLDELIAEVALLRAELDGLRFQGMEELARLRAELSVAGARGLLERMVVETSVACYRAESELSDVESAPYRANRRDAIRALLAYREKGAAE